MFFYFLRYWWALILQDEAEPIEEDVPAKAEETEEKEDDDEARAEATFR